MTRLEPYLFINRLVIVSQDGGVAYDETFHRGVNIIRGANSSGKSTIANFIFYSLGGDYSNWTAGARKCREVYVEVEISQATLTLKRAVNASSQQSMGVYWGNYQAAKNASFEGWQYYPYKSSDNKESFSNLLFNALGFPQVRSSEDSKITINQVLRLIYIDQESPTQSLYRFERFDLPMTRQAVSELLLGVYEDSLYGDRLRLREAEQMYQQKKEKFDEITMMFTSTGGEPDVNKIVDQIDKVRSRINVINDKIIQLRSKKVVKLQDKSPLKIEKLQLETGALKAKVGAVLSEIKEIELDIVDSIQFIEALEKRLVALDASMVTRKALGELSLEFCPHCLKPLGEHTQVENCVLCKQPLEKGADKTYSKRLKQTIELQIKESKKLLEDKRKRQAELSGNAAPLLEQLRLRQKEIDLEERENKSTRDDTLDDFLIERGRLESHIEFLSKQIKFAEQLDSLKKEAYELRQSIDELKTNIELKERQQKANLQKAHLEIETIALSILKQDLPRQNEFQNGESVDINFFKDTFALDGENNFSASSNIYLKNAVRYAIFFASLKLPYFRYPRFILCDNMEDKGMEKERSQNFQNVIVKMSQSFDIDHQIIFTTSMIDDVLDKSSLCVGAKYDINNKSLKV